jgi:excisionase family DNA binding protein
MSHKAIPDPGDGYCGTSYAAKLLNLSVGTVQTLVEKNELQAWKTQGGHRRISLQSVEDYQRRHRIQSNSILNSNERLRVLVVEDDDSLLRTFQAHFDKWDLAIDATCMTSAIEALLDLPVLKPQVLITDLRLPGVDGFELIRRLNQHPQLSGMAVLAMTGMSAADVARKGGLPEGVQMLRKPIDLGWLHGYFHALLSLRQLSQRQGHDTENV